MKVCVYGAGAIGGHLAAKLARAGHDVSVVVRDTAYEAIVAKGITLVTKDDSFDANVRATTDASTLGVQDAVIFTVKATAIPSLAGFLPLFDEHTAAVFVLNGIPFWYASGRPDFAALAPILEHLDPGGRVLNALRPERIVGCIAFSANIVTEPGVIHNRSERNCFTLGELDGSASARVRVLSRSLEQAGVSSPVSTDIRKALWKKLVETNMSVMPVCVLAEGTSSVLADPNLADLAHALMEEGKQIARAHGIKLDIDTAAPFPISVLTSSHKPSMLQDIEARRPAEIDSILSVPQAFARAADLRTPYLDTVTALITQKAARGGSYRKL